MKIYAIVKMLNANQDDIDKILSHPNLVVLANILHCLCASDYAGNQLMFYNRSLNLPRETLLKFLEFSSIDAWWGALRLLSSHQLLIAPAVDELISNPNRVIELAQMSKVNCEKDDVEKCLYSGKDLGSEKHFSRW